MSAGLDRTDLQWWWAMSSFMFHASSDWSSWLHLPVLCVQIQMNVRRTPAHLTPNVWTHAALLAVNVHLATTLRMDGPAPKVGAYTYPTMPNHYLSYCISQALFRFTKSLFFSSLAKTFMGTFRFSMKNHDSSANMHEIQRDIMQLVRGSPHYCTVHA